MTETEQRLLLSEWEKAGQDAKKEEKRHSSAEAQRHLLSCASYARSAEGSGSAVQHWLLTALYGPCAQCVSVRTSTPSLNRPSMQSHRGRP